MAFVSSHNMYPFALLVLFFVSSDFYNGIYGLENRQKVPATNLDVVNHDHCQSCKRKVSSLKDVHTYSELKYDPRASLPFSFTFCVSVLVTTNNLHPSLFTLLGNDGQPWFSVKITQYGSFVGRKFYYPVAQEFANMDTMRMFPNQWVRSCLAFNTLSGLVQWVARGELVDNSTIAGITNNVPKDLSGKVVLGSHYYTNVAKWVQSSNKLTKLEIFSSALAVTKMMEYTRGEGCGDDGDYLSWDDMQWNFHGGAKIEHLEAEETCEVPLFNYFSAGFEMKACMHLCENLGRSRALSTSLLQWERASSIFYWIPIHDEQNEGEWRNFYDNKVLNFTRYVLYPPSKEKVHFYAPNSVKNLGIH